MTATAQRERIIVIEDEPDIAEVMEYNLRREGYRVSGARDGEEGLEAVRSQFPDAVLLDIMLPTLGGLEVCRRLKADPHLRAIPVILVTAKGEVDDVVAGLEAGADDYITKPFSPRELLARIKAVLRRGHWDDSRPSERIVADGMVIDTVGHEVRVEGKPISLTATEFRLLEVLARNPGRVFTRNNLLDRAIGRETTVTNRNIDVHVGAIRRKLGRQRGLIETVRGVGYRFRAT